MTFRSVRSCAAAFCRRALPALAVMLFAALPLLAQEGASSTAPATSDGGGALSLWELIVLSGFVGWVIIFLSIVTLAVIIENYVTLSREKLAPPEIVDEIQSLFEEGQFQEAMELCENEPSFFTRVCRAGIAKIGQPFEVIQTALQDMGNEESIRLNQKIGWISVLAAVSPMLGLFGTVQGMIASFHIIANTANPTPAQLASGIYVALLTTFEGLMVAIPATAAFAYIRNRLVRNIIEVGAIVEDLFERFRPKNNQ